MKRKKSFEFALPLSLVLVLAGACDFQGGKHGDDNPEGKNIMGHDAIVLGSRLEDPFEVGNMTKALASVYPTKAERVVLEPTDKYVRFLPADDEQMEHLCELGVELLDHPMDFEIVREGDYYHDPSVASDKITWLYAVVPVGFEFPLGIKYEEIHDCFLAENAPSTKALSDVDWAEVERQSFVLTGNASMLDTCARTKAESGTPKGRIVVCDPDYDSEPMGVAGVKVRCNVFVKTATAYTDERGEYEMGKTFNSKPRYRLEFVNRLGFKLGFNLILMPASVSTLGSGKATGLDVTINDASDGALFRRAVVNNAAYEYYSSCKSAADGSIKTPPSNLRIWLMPLLSNSCTPMFQQGVIINSDAVTTILGNYTLVVQMFLPDVLLGLSGKEDYKSVYRTTIHSLAHASHFRNVGQSYWEEFFYHIVSSWIASNGVSYGTGMEDSHGCCEVAEMWAYYMENAFVKDRYPNSYDYAGTSYWFYPQIFMYLDERGVNRFRIFRALSSDVNDRDILKSRLVSLYPESRTAINEAFLRYY